MRVGRTSAGPALLVAAVAAVGVLLWLDPRHPPFQHLDTGWREVMLATRGPILTEVAMAADVVGRLPVWLVLAALVAGWCGLRRRWLAVGYVVVVTVATTLATAALKQGVPRPRPADGMVLVDVGSYPSGHVVHTTTTVLVTVLLAGPAVRRYGWVIVLAVAAWMGWSRTYLSVHWLSDVLAGAAFAVGVCLLVWRCWAPELQREAARSATGAAPPPPDEPNHPDPTAR